jgi:hypothetical protein
MFEPNILLERLKPELRAERIKKTFSDLVHDYAPVATGLEPAEIIAGRTPRE